MSDKETRIFPGHKLVDTLEKCTLECLPRIIETRHITQWRTEMHASLTNRIQKKDRNDANINEEEGKQEVFGYWRRIGDRYRIRNKNTRLPRFVSHNLPVKCGISPSALPVAVFSTREKRRKKTRLKEDPASPCRTPIEKRVPRHRKKKFDAELHGA